MNSVDPVDAVGAPTSDLKRIAPIPAADGPSLQDLTQRFQALMNSQPDAVSGLPDHGTAVGRVLETQDQLQHSADHAMDHLRRHGEQMGAEAHMALSIEASRLQAAAQFRLQAISSVANGTNKSLQTLLKNS